jgi:hypothetical protein
MKKIAVFGFMFFIIFSQLFADENSNEYKNITFAWQLLYLKNTNQEIKYSNLNPLFYNTNNDFFLMKLYVNDARYSISQRSQNTNSQNNDIYGFIGSLFLFSGYTYFYSSMNRQEREIINNTWEQRQNEEQMRQKLLRNNNRY